MNLKLVSSIERNAKHYVEILSRAVDKIMPPTTEGITFKTDVLDLIAHQRHLRTDLTEAAISEGREGVLERETMYPAELMRRYDLSFKPREPSGASDRPNDKALAIRAVRGEHLGHLITVRGIATRVTDVKPAIQVLSLIHISEPTRPY